MFTYLLRAMATRPYTVEGQHDCYESDWRHAKSPYMDTSLHWCCPSTVYGHTLDRYIYALALVTVIHGTTIMRVWCNYVCVWVCT